MSEAIERILDAATEPTVRGYLHRPESPNGDALILAHGAGSNAQSPLLVAVAGAFAEAGFTVLRIDLPFRQVRPHGPPFPAMADKGQEGNSTSSGVYAPVCAGACVSGRTLVRRPAGDDARGGRAGPRVGIAVAVVSAASAAQAGAEERCAFSEAADAGAVCAWKSGSVWIARGDGAGVEVDSGANRVSDSRRGWARSEGDGVGEDSSGEVCGVLWWT